MKKISYLAMLVIAFITTSCLGSSDTKVELTRSLGSAHNFTVTQRYSDQAQFINGSGADYKLEISVTEGKVSLSVMDLFYWEGQPRVSFRVIDAPYKINETSGAFELEVENVEGSNVKISDLKVYSIERQLNPNSYEIYPAWDITFTVDDMYQVRAVQDILLLFGKASSTEIDTDKTFEDEKAYYQLVFEPKSVKDGDKVGGSIIMYNASYTAGMPPSTLKLEFTDATVNFAGFSINSGTMTVYELRGDSWFVNPDYEITSFSGGGAWSLKNVAPDRYPYYLDFTVGGKYNVGLDLGYHIPENFSMGE